MTSLPQQLRNTLTLTLDDNITHAEAGNILGVSEGTISWRITEVKKHLHDLHQKEQTA